MKPLRMMVLFVFAMIAVGCQERVVIGDNGQLPATDAGEDQAEAEADAGVYAEASPEAEADVQVETSEDAQPDAEADAVIDTAPALKTCTVQNTANLGVADPIFLETVGGQGFGLGLCPAADSVCVLKTLSFQGDPTGNIDVTGSKGQTGVVPFGSKDGYVVSYQAEDKFHITSVVNNALTIDTLVQPGPVMSLAALETGGYWIGQYTGDPMDSSSTAFIRYIAPNGLIGNQLVLAYAQFPGVQNNLAGVATIGQVVGAAVNTVDNTGLQTTSAFLRQEDGTIKRVDLDTFQANANPFSYVYGMTTLGGRFVVKWTSVADTIWTGHLSIMNTDGTGLETVDVSTEQMVTTIGENIAAVEYDQVMLKTVLRIYDDKLQPVTEPLTVVKDIKGYYMNYPRARGNSLDSIMVAYTEKQPDTTFAIKAAIISCQ